MAFVLSISVDRPLWKCIPAHLTPSLSFPPHKFQRGWEHQRIGNNSPKVVQPLKKTRSQPHARGWEREALQR